jgi:hypothetical protein
MTSVQISAEMVTPSLTVPLDLETADVDNTGLSSSLEPGKSLQRIVRHDLKEEGNHVLAVTVAYTEPYKILSVEQQEESGTAGARVRTFRKLYQFIAQQCIAVRTKSGDLPPIALADERGGSTKTRLVRYVLEAQLENMGEVPICLEVCFYAFVGGDRSLSEAERLL